MVEKITKLVTEVTAEQKDIEWGEVQSQRIKMLQLSDWTQLEDVTLPDNHKREWRLWRQKVRNISRKTVSTPKIARDSLHTLQNAIPAYDTLDQSLFEKKLNEEPVIAQVSEPSVRYEKVIVKEQPVILTHIMPAAEFELKLNEFIQKNPERFQDMLRTVMIVDTSIIIFPDDSLDSARNKVMNYLKTRQKELLSSKLSTISNLEVLAEKVEEALTFMTTNQPNIEDYPLIHLYSDVYQQDYTSAASDFLLEKKQYNRILFEAERFLLYTQHRLNNAENIEAVKEILKEIKNGY